MCPRWGCGAAAAVFAAQALAQDCPRTTLGDIEDEVMCPICGTPLGSEEGMKDKLESNMNKARALLKEAGYDVEKPYGGLETAFRATRRSGTTVGTTE